MRDFKCETCNIEFESLVEENEAGVCPKCLDSESVIRAPSTYGGYAAIPGNGSSVRPKRAGYNTYRKK